MTEDEQAIRQVVATWMEASQSGDTATVLSHMTEDVIFMVPGQEPFGREAFEATAGGSDGARPKIDGTNDIVEIQVLGTWAFTRNRIGLQTLPYLVIAGIPVFQARDDATLILAFKAAMQIAISPTE